jgi:protease-4
LEVEMKVKEWLGLFPVRIGIAVLCGLAVVFLGVWLPKKAPSSEPAVGVIAISGTIQSSTATEVVDMLRYAAEEGKIAGVVLEVESFGGGATPTEEIYLAILHLKEKKPVVVSLTDGLSGGYYIAAAGNYIYAKPSSFVGNVGVRWGLPSSEEVEEDLVLTGPYKATGFSIESAMDALELVKEGFLQAVIVQRGERLKMTKEELSQARVYTGVEAMNNGLVDAIGARPDALAKVAELAGLRTYKVVDINRMMLLKEIEEASRAKGNQGAGDLVDVLRFLKEQKAERDEDPAMPLPHYEYP